MSYLGPASFYICSLLAVSGALGTVLSRNAIRSAMCLLATIVGIAGLYVALSAQLLAAVQLIVYAGAVVVLFVFVIMMIGPSGSPTRDNRTFKTRAAGAGLFAAATLVALGLVWKAAALLNLFDMSTLAKKTLKGAPSFPHVFDPPRPDLGSVEGLGRALFGEGMVAFELSGLLLLVAIVGVMAIARTRQPASTKEPGALPLAPTDASSTEEPTS
ncbi:MAG: NADH-quinone oxidoreductase subunit J [Deltaproteobacteria bacterium]|nr:NADH-quinone oxidoreductase subunit J [Deltaproteobacteria bacterium]